MVTFLAILIVGIYLSSTPYKRKIRLKLGFTLVILAIVSYPIPMYLYNLHWENLHAISDLIFFNLILFMGGIITLIMSSKSFLENMLRKHRDGSAVRNQWEHGDGSVVRTQY
jgi:Na+-transporting NADH:ubiquinone oxidoreductase subunit NqrE